MLVIPPRGNQINWGPNDHENLLRHRRGFATQWVAIAAHMIPRLLAFQIQKLITERLLQSSAFHRFARSSYENAGRLTEVAKEKLQDLTESGPKRTGGLSTFAKFLGEEFRGALRRK